MLWFILGILITATVYFVGRKLYNSNSYSRTNSWWAIPTGAAMLALALLTNAILNDQYSQRTEVKVSELEVVSDGSTTHGAFFLFGGYIKSDPVYTYYEKNELGEYRLDRVRAHHAFVTYTDGTPQVIEYRVDSANHWLAAFVGWDTFGPWEFRIPEGSIKQDYTLDTK